MTPTVSGSLSKFIFADYKSCLNFTLLAVLWSLVQFTYYIFNFMLRFLPGDLLSNAFASAYAEILGVLVSGILYHFLGLNFSLFTSFMISTVGAYLLLDGQVDWFLTSIYCFAARTGICLSYNILNFNSKRMFPPDIQDSAMLTLNLIGRIITIGAPMLAEVQG